MQGAAPEGEQQQRLQGQLGETLRENQLLKRAVAIQNSRLQELGCVCGCACAGVCVVGAEDCSSAPRSADRIALTPAVP